MQEAFEEVIRLQAEWSGENTPSMQRRGQLIRYILPGEIREIGDRLRKEMGRVGEGADAEGRDATGTKSRIPWVRWYSPLRSASAQQGWYVVYLFHPDASGVSLCLSHGSTFWDGRAVVERSDEEVTQLMSWAAGVVGTEFRSDPSVRRGIELGSFFLARAYERTTFFSKFYARGAVPNDTVIAADLARFAIPLGKLYQALDQGVMPGAVSPDRLDVEAEIAKIATPTKTPAKGQGRVLSAPLRKLIELRAMELARDWLAEQGFSFTDVSSTDSCDFRAERAGEQWVVEVKGTTGGPNSIIITRNEVALHITKHPRNILIIVHGIELDAQNGRASGGVLQEFSPWVLDEERLDPICYEYRF